MTDEFAHNGFEERLDSERGERSSSRPDCAVHAAGPPRQVLTDGGQAEMEASEDETADSDAEGDAEEAPENEETEGEGEEEIEEPEAEVAEEPEAKEETKEEAEESEAEKAEKEAAEDDYHVEDAEDVYQDEAVAGVLHLDLDGLFLDLLGLEVNLNPVTLDVSARPGENNLLGNLLAAVSGLFNGAGGMLETVESLLNKPSEFLDALFGDRGADDETEGEGAEPGDDSPGRISRAIGWLKEKLAAFVPSFPTEEIVAAIVSEVIEQVVERFEPERPEETSEQREPSQAEATA
ncbi:hypothetical protein [Natrinema hispanicum]|uniref:Uncharacterized protein n=1 Tax=Natrinema hispanicum TaxID=392421 RepID=A0A1G6JKC7_9EURY|nr:hypothetical protein [Natrinema hispanicum]SDC19108.1 hypothetical protein SAMN05192552_100277 [Natrinema hispanicum]SES67382.1 hypothetical protein SAMN04488694_10177 [Natrinema hispanicum]